MTGLKVRQTDTDLVLRDAEDREVSIPVSSIEDQKIGGSLMPAGLTDPLTRAELVDLVRFLSELGKVGPYSVSKTPVARRWQVLLPRNDLSKHLHISGYDFVATNPEFPWKPAYAQVSGVLPFDDVLTLPVPYEDPKVGLARCQVEVSTPGKVRFKLPMIAGLKLWVDATRVEPAATVDLDLTTGVHSLTFLIPKDGKTLDGLRLELQDAAGSSARAQMVLGK